MSGFRTVHGFEEVWRPPVAGRAWPEAVLPQGPEARARLWRIVRRAPEVVVKIAGKPHDRAKLAAHLAYVSRDGRLPLEDGEGWPLSGSRAVRELAEDWAALTATAAALCGELHGRGTLSLSVVLSMPAGTDALALRDAARGFARTVFERFEHVMVMHTDTPQPHVHLDVLRLGRDGARLSPRLADLVAWRQRFAAELRARGVEAEATPRRARGVVRKPERGPLWRLRRRWETGLGAPGRVQRDVLADAARLAVLGTTGSQTPWERATLARQERVRALYLAQARLLLASADVDDRALGLAVARFVRDMPPAETQRQALARALREANTRAARTADRPARDAATTTGRDEVSGCAAVRGDRDLHARGREA